MHEKRHGRRIDAGERERKREARSVHKSSKVAQKTRGLKAKLLNQKRYKEKVEMKKTIAKHEEKEVEKGDGDNVPKGALPAYLLDREGVSRAKVLSNTVKEKRKEKAGKWAVPLPKVRCACRCGFGCTCGLCGGLIAASASPAASLGPPAPSRPLSFGMPCPALPCLVLPCLIAGAPHQRRRDVCERGHGQAEGQDVEAHGDQGHLRRGELHPQGAKGECQH